MLSITECRKILGPSCPLSDSDLEQYRDSLRAFANNSFEAFPKNPKAHNSLPFDKKATFEEMLKLLSESEQEEAIERASILEFDGRLSRPEAERIALNKYFEKFYIVSLPKKSSTSDFLKIRIIKIIDSFCEEFGKKLAWFVFIVLGTIFMDFLK